MIHLISHANAHLYGEEIKALHRARAAVFIDELGWKLRASDGMEIDEYDDERAGNMVGFSANNDVVMGLRFRPTDDRSMLTDHFPHALSSGTRPINDNYTWELSRGFCRERGVRRQQLRRKAVCMIAPLELAYEAGMNRCVGFTDLRMLNFCYGVGWKLHLLGSPVHYGEGHAVAYEVEVSRSALVDMRSMWGIATHAYLELTELEPGDSSVHEAAERLAQVHPELKMIAAPRQDEPDKPASPAKSSASGYYSAFSAMPSGKVAG